MQYDIQDRRKVYSILESEGIEIPRYAVLDRDSPDPKRKFKTIQSTMQHFQMKFIEHNIIIQHIFKGARDLFAMNYQLELIPSKSVLQ